MNKIELLIKELSSSEKHEVDWLGGADQEQITILEEALCAKLPEDFKIFLNKVGGGGVVDQELSGIENNDALIDYGGNIYYDTIYCRSEFSLPEKLVVIYFYDDDICWYIDTSESNFGKVVNYNLFDRKVDGILSSNFTEFFEEYVKLRTQ
ncbi:SMI1/KNR4 family protein [Photorhabdus caribbeanensis]|uniref:SMI1/KNR4 family protein n=1 Tax=Photorhabdus caribbeanensis TaxID=1004165 RepID=UPI001BD1F30B|nr:SMI1/KNR4 family protein [Photorhabdus caribbeanensis]MBS9426323.1 SMI1/KNR4 family protein [Photorhabdus caribbeanensis]